jgi:hypothetical protein
LKKLNQFLGATVLYLSMLLLAVPAMAATITFDTLVTGATSFGYDGDGDLIVDVIFSTTDAGGFNTFGPGADQAFINEPGLEGTTLLSPDLRVDFLNGASGNLSFGLATSGFSDGADGVSFNIYDAADNLLASTFDSTYFTPSSFPEAFVSLGFGGVAAYATFDFTSVEANRYIIDNFSGTFGSTEDVVPIPAAVWLFGSALGGLGWMRRRKTV